MIVVLSGPGGVGKGTIAQRLLQVDPRLRLSRSWTTRPRRPSEPEDVYVWSDPDGFEAHRAAGGFLETDRFLDNLYGTPVPEADSIEAGCDLLLEINVQGAEQIRRRDPSTLVVFIVAPDRAVQESRLRARGDDELHVLQRLSIADAEEVKGRVLADVIVVNDDLDRAVAEVAAVIESARGRVA